MMKTLLSFIFCFCFVAVYSQDNPCSYTFKETKCTEKEKKIDNFFGEDVTIYDEKTVVYVYDFNKNVSLRKFYRIYLKKIKGKEKKEIIKDRPEEKDFIKLPDQTIVEMKNDGNGEVYKLIIESVNPNRDRLQPTKDVHFRIVNVNKFMYDVSVDNKVITYDSEMPTLLKEMFIGGNNILGSFIKGYTSNFTEEDSLTQKQMDALNSVSEKITCFITRYNVLQEKALEAYDPCATFPCCFSVGYAELADSLIIIKGEIAKILPLMEDEKKIVAKNEKDLADCVKNVEDIKKTKTEIEAIDKLSEAERAKPENVTKRKTLTAALDGQEKKLKDCEDNKEKYEKAIADAKSKLAEFTAINASIASLPSDKDLKKLVVFLRNMVDQNQNHSVNHISLDGNELDIEVNITSRDSIFKHFAIPPYKSLTHLKIPILWKPFINFSSGSFVALGRSLQSKTYGWQEVTDDNNTATDTGYILVESGYTNPAAGFSAMVNLEWKIARSLGFGPSVGVGLTIEKKPQLAYLVGGSLFIGNKNQLAITGGLAGMQVDRISQNFLTASNNQTVYTSKQDIDYFKDFKIGAFISLTYTVFTLTKNK